jgi:glutamate-5-semialdehyde dehydrogenase
MTGLKEIITKQVHEARRSVPFLRDLPETTRSTAIREVARLIRQKESMILSANQRDLELAHQGGLSAALIDRLTLTHERVEQLAQATEGVAAMAPVVNVEVASWQRPNGLIVTQKTVPLGVIAFIFESRPNVLVDAAVLALKSGNALLAKGGKEAEFTNQCLGRLIQEALAEYVPAGGLQVVSAMDRSAVTTLLEMDDDIDLVIPRGGEALIRFVKDNTKIPVIAHDKGLCHLYIHYDAESQKTIKIAVNAKAQRPGVCNAVESILIHQGWPSSAVQDLVAALRQAGVEVRGDELLQSLVPHIVPAIEADWETEYLDKIVAIKMVASLEEAISHIERYGSHHTEAICAKDPAAISMFEAKVDASMIAINASTRFNDGGELGIGPEIGISTSKLHCYGPMGAKQLTTLRYVVKGDGQCR